MVFAILEVKTKEKPWVSIFSLKPRKPQMFFGSDLQHSKKTLIFTAVEHWTSKNLRCLKIVALKEAYLGFGFIAIYST